MSLSPPSALSTACDEPLVAELVHAAGVVADGGEAAAVVLLPLGALLGLEPVLVVDAHEPALGHELVEQLGDALAELGAVVGEVLDEEVGEERGGGPQPGLAADGAARDLGDEEDQRADPGLQLAVGALGAQAADELVDLLEQHAALQHARRLLLVDEVAADDVADRIARRRRAAASWTILQLGAQHAGLAGAVDRAQGQLPEAAAGGQQRVVGDEVRLVGGLGRELGAAEVPSISPLTASSVALSAGTCSGFLRSTTSRTTVSTSVSESATWTAKRSVSFWSVGVAVSALWPVATNEHLALEARRAALDDVLHREGLLVVVADVLLHLVEHDEGERQLAVGRSTGGEGRRP